MILLFKKKKAKKKYGKKKFENRMETAKKWVKKHNK